MPSTDCLSDEILGLMLDGRLDPGTARTIEAHVASCSACRALTAHAVRVAPPQTREAPPLDPTRPPAQIDHFRILRPLGGGGMGQVYLGHDTQLDREVAIKFIRLLAEDVSDDAARARFQREARAIARLSHPNVVAVYQIGEIQGSPYLVSEYVRGQSLDRLPTPLPWRRVLHLALGLARGLRAAHRGGVLHRDIKPANAILDEEGHVKLLDFGLAKLLDELAGRSNALSSSTAVLGTPRYLAPEGWESCERLTERSDIYSLGVLLYELCAGVPPHTQNSLPSLCHSVCNTDAAPLWQAAPGVDPAFAALIDRCLRRDPAARPASAAELVESLQALIGHDLPPTPSPPRGRQRLSLAIGGVLLCASAGGYLAYREVGTAEAPRGAALAGGAGSMPPMVPIVEALPPQREEAFYHPELILVPGGTFLMGSNVTESQAARDACKRLDLDPRKHCKPPVFAAETPQRRVQISPFHMARTEVTIGEVAAWLNRLTELRIDPDKDTGTPRWVKRDKVLLVDLYPSVWPPFGLVLQDGRYVALSGFERKPMAHITWDGAQRFCQAAGLRLPTEAEWEFAARGEERRTYPWGFAAARCEGVVFHRVKGGACGHLPSEFADVGTSPQDRTPLGILDLGGNVGEWVSDQFSSPYPPCGERCIDPAERPAPAPPGERVVRGGSLPLTAEGMRGARRSRVAQDDLYTDIGFRCAK